MEFMTYTPGVRRSKYGYKVHNWLSPMYRSDRRVPRRPLRFSGGVKMKIAAKAARTGRSFGSVARSAGRTISKFFRQKFGGRARSARRAPFLSVAMSRNRGGAPRYTSKLLGNKDWKKELLSYM